MMPEFPIVGIGASAGGLEALRQFFGALPKEPGMSFVVVQHLDPHHESILSQLIQQATAMTVEQAGDSVRIEPNTVYVIPPNRNISLFHGTIQLTPADPRRMPIDHFFRSLAEDQAEHAICIILSGTGTDGTTGIRAVSETGGVVFVQDPVTAKYDGMPKSAVETGLADYVSSTSSAIPSWPVQNWVNLSLDSRPSVCLTARQSPGRRWRGPHRPSLNW
jgi:two-component system CheB/CheR fusion protein